MRIAPAWIAAASSAALACAAPPASGPAGTWRGHVIEPGGARHELTLTLTLDGDQVRGSVSTPPEEARPIIAGRRDGNRLAFRIGVPGPTPAGDTVALALTVDGDRMQGTVTMPDNTAIPLEAERSDGRAAGKPDRPGRAVVRAPGPGGPDAEVRPAIEALLAAFATHDLVGGMSASHGNKDTDDFILALVRHPDLPDKANDIVVECGNALFQGVLDRYVAGEQVPLDSVRRVWRDTSQPNCGVSAFYEQLFPLVRRLNALRPSSRRLRVLAGDPPIDWSRVHRSADLAPFRDRDGSIADVIEREVLAKHRKALLLFGVNHVRHGANAAAVYEARHPGVSWVVADHHGFGGRSPLSRRNDELEARMTGWPVPSLVAIEGSWLADVPCALFDLSFPSEGCTGYPGVDAYLYVGRRDVLLREPGSAAALLDADYLAEMRRRAEVIGLPNPSDPELLLRREREEGTFLERP